MATSKECPIKQLFPTQLTVGMIEVKDKKAALLALKPKDQSAFMAAHPIPAIVGPGGRLYITDHHHLARAALEAGVGTGICEIEADLSSSRADKFWDEMNENLWVHPLDEYGVRHVYSALPQHIEALVDDIYRSLAGYVRDAGGYEKTPTAFAEFVWADYFRRSLAVEAVKADFHAAVKAALPLAKSRLAKGLPGYLK
jgi:hypothetical protein